jgi:hypothetical protein
VATCYCPHRDDGHLFASVQAVVVATCSRVSKRWLWPPVRECPSGGCGHLFPRLLKQQLSGGTAMAGGGGGGVDIRGFFFSSLVLNFGRRKREGGLGRGDSARENKKA